MLEENILLQRVEGEVLVLTLNRPDKYNALSNDLMSLLHDALIDFDKNDALKVCVLTGAGRNFCTGADIKQFGDAEAQTEEAIAKRAQISMEVNGMAANISKPLITSVRGYALAGGCGVALSADMVIASDNALFGYPEVKRGFVPALVMVNLSKLVGRHRALQMLLTGDRIPADKALEWGLINFVVPDEDLEEFTMKFAHELAEKSTTAVKMIKNLFYEASELSLNEGLQKAKAANEAMRKTKDFSEGVGKFKQGEKA